MSRITHPRLAAGPAHLLSCGGRELTRPTGIVVLARRDANVEIQNTRWSRWTATAARGTTTLDINLGNPNCAASRTRSFPGSSVRLSGVVGSPSGPVFSRVTITYGHAGQDATVTAYPRP
jgi:hypothetical protein